MAESNSLPSVQDKTDDIEEEELDSAMGEINLNKNSKPSSVFVNDKTAITKPSPNTTSTVSTTPTNSAAQPNVENIWSEEYFNQMTQDLQKNMESLVNGDSEQLDSLLEQLMSGVTSAVPPPGEAATGVESNESNQDNQSIEEKLKSTMEEIMQGLNSLPISGNRPDGEGGGPNMMPFLEDIMQQFLSKDVLYPVFSETCAKYPEWLEKNKESQSKEEYDKYSKQNEIMQKVVDEFDKESDSDSAAVKKERFNTILELLQKMQEYGSPPKDLVGAEGLPPEFETSMNSLTGKEACSIM
uniref:Peroxin-19 n=2 Tax=Cacopsylla melanoneura TaxID=428564 RepID=A0A8D9BR44_9HEMI